MGRTPPASMDDQGKLESERGKDSPKQPSGGKRAACKQDFTAGLKQIYDSVVEDPIPPHLMALLAKFDEKEDQ